MVVRSPVADEIERRMKLLKWTQARLSREAGFDEKSTYVRDILRGKSRNPEAQGLIAVADALGCAVGDLSRSSNNDSRSRTRVRIDNIRPNLADEPRARWATPVQEVSTYTGMGGGGLMDSEEPIGTWQLPTDWLRSEIRGTHLGDLRIVTLEGDSMEGTLEPGDKVIVDLSRKVPSPPGLFVIWDGLAQVAKRLSYMEGSDPPSVAIISDNDRYSPYNRTLEEINVVGRIMGRWQRLS